MLHEFLHSICPRAVGIGIVGIGPSAMGHVIGAIRADASHRDTGHGIDQVVVASWRMVDQLRPPRAVRRSRPHSWTIEPGSSNNSTRQLLSSGSMLV